MSFMTVYYRNKYALCFDHLLVVHCTFSVHRAHRGGGNLSFIMKNNYTWKQRRQKSTRLLERSQLPVLLIKDEHRSNQTLTSTRSSVSGYKQSRDGGGGLYEIFSYCMLIISLEHSAWCSLAKWWLIAQGPGRGGIRQRRRILCANRGEKCCWISQGFSCGTLPCMRRWKQDIAHSVRQF